MNKQDSIEFKLRPALQECWRHQARLNAAWQEAINFHPIELAVANLRYLVMHVPTLEQSFLHLADAANARILTPAQSSNV
jgi:hypothetical protein